MIFLFSKLKIIVFWPVIRFCLFIASSGWIIDSSNFLQSLKFLLADRFPANPSSIDPPFKLVALLPKFQFGFSVCSSTKSPIIIHFSRAYRFHARNFVSRATNLKLELFFDPLNIERIPFFLWFLQVKMFWKPLKFKFYIFTVFLWCLWEKTFCVIIVLLRK